MILAAALQLTSDVHIEAEQDGIVLVSVDGVGGRRDHSQGQVEAPHQPYQVVAGQLNITDRPQTCFTLCNSSRCPHHLQRHLRKCGDALLVQVHRLAFEQLGFRPPPQNWRQRW